MKTEAKHTPTLVYTPAETTGLSNGKIRKGFLRDENGNALVYGDEGFLRPIVHAVNAYEELVETAKEFRNAAPPLHELSPRMQMAYDALGRAIAKAEGQK